MYCQLARSAAITACLHPARPSTAGGNHAVDTWTTESLYRALEGTEAATSGAIRFELIRGADDSIAATMVEFGDLGIVMNVGAEQILAQVLLWQVGDLKEPDGDDYYELFGALSAASKLENIVLELETLADNAIEAAEAYAAYR